MGALESLTRSGTIALWDVSVFWTFVFGALFLFGWLSEEFAASEKRKSHRKLFLTLAIVGVIGEQLGTVAEFALSGHLQTIDEAAIAEANARAAEAEKKAEQFRLAIADANERAASAEKATGQERLARLKLEATLAPRNLTTAQQAALANEVKARGLGPQRIDIFVFTQDPEAVVIALEIASALSQVPWESQTWSCQARAGDFVKGIVVIAEDRTNWKAANALAAALVEQHVSATFFNQTTFDLTKPPCAVMLGPPWNAHAPAPIRLLIGRKF